MAWTGEIMNFVKSGTPHMVIHVKGNDDGWVLSRSIDMSRESAHYPNGTGQAFLTSLSGESGIPAEAVEKYGLRIEPLRGEWEPFPPPRYKKWRLMKTGACEMGA